MFNGQQLEALDAAKIGTSGRMAYALVCWAQKRHVVCSYAFLARQLGVSSDRAQRVIADLRKAKIVTVVKEYKEGAYVLPGADPNESDPD